MNIENLIFKKNKRLLRFSLRQINRFLIRPYVRWRNIPLIAITGTNGKTTVSRLLNRIYLSAGYNIGMCCTAGVQHNGVPVARGDYSHGLGIWHASRGRVVDILVAETARGGILKFGLGYARSMAGVVTNVYEDHLGLEGVQTIEQMAEVKSAIPRHTTPQGTVVLNGDQALVRSMISRTRASGIYFTVEDEQDRFDHCYYLHDGHIFRKSGSFKKRILDVKSLPITLQGTLTYNVANVMAALATVEAMQPWVPVQLETVQTVLQEFGMNPNDNPTRLNLLRIKDRYVLLCTCKNPESYRRDAETIRTIQKKYKFDHVIGMLTAPGDRRQDFYEQISHTVAPLCSYFFVRPPLKRYLRIRTGEEIVRLLSASIPAERILSTENLPLESIFDWTRKTIKGTCLYVYFYATLESNLDIMRLISESQHIPIEIGEKLWRL